MVCDSDVTKMRRGGYRAECVCGWWQDVHNEEMANQEANNHVGYLQHRFKPTAKPKGANNEPTICNNSTGNPARPLQPAIGHTT
jgi:predicted metal-dependent phosphotriesterase family hydrolase